MTREVEFDARCRAFGRRMGMHHIHVSVPDRAVRVWDEIAGHYTRCHSLSDRTVQRFLRRGLAMAGEV